jgi:hypothetical protein
MSTEMTVLWTGLVVAVAAAVRSTWSPCGLSMLSSITPFAERGRGHRYGATAGWFVAGATLGGATLGGAAAFVAWAVAATGSGGDGVRLGLAATLAVTAALVDGGAFGPVLPVIRRQVDDRWLTRYRPWVYGLGFGWQIGVGLATYVMTAGVLLVGAFGALSGSPVLALLLGSVFGAGRGSSVLLTRRAQAPDALRDLHRWLDRIGPAVARIVVALEAAAGGALAVGTGLAVSGSVPSAYGGPAELLGLVLAGAVVWRLTALGRWARPALPAR